ncbi:cyclophilin-like fold protein [Flavobacterium psychrolimnae]|uniref:cyclophilin-like fold protein n=1 Tax=Flavobacterium psychrolimnae TaxID=249351 RepID=UPI001AC00314|nr:cyclophilin-like fold protein [Flavobacterium psychrolimnae]
MKNLITTIFVFISFSVSLASCNQEEKTITNQTNGNTTNPIGSKMKITIDTSVFTATLTDDETTAAFQTILPMTINMSELNGNEKFFYFASTLPSNASPGGSIQVGDLMLYGNNCLVLFYENLNTSYSYSRLGKIDNTTGLVAALGSGNVTIKLELE